MVRIDEPGPKIDEIDIATFETRRGIQLPDAYRQFLIRHNGGIPSPDIVDIPNDPKGPTDVQVFFGISTDIESSDLSWNFELVKSRYLGVRLLPIACDSGGNLFCLHLSEAQEFIVVYLDINAPPGSIYKVASGFDEFLGKFRNWE